MTSEQVKTKLQTILAQAEKYGQADTSISDNDPSMDRNFQDTMQQLGINGYFKSSIAELIQQL